MTLNDGTADDRRSRPDGVDVGRRKWIVSSSLPVLETNHPPPPFLGLLDLESGPVTVVAAFLTASDLDNYINSLTGGGTGGEGGGEGGTEYFLFH